jgi:hypothetical protein
MLADPEDKLTVIRSVRMSEKLMRLITEECNTRKLDFSDYMRYAAMAAMTPLGSSAQ